LAPFIALFPALVTYAVIPFGEYTVGDRQVPLVVADLDVGILYIFAFASLGVYGVMLAGWGSYNSYSLLGGMRAASQMISYEVAMGLAALGVLMVYGSVEMDEIVQRQGNLLWGILLQPVGFILFLGASIAETRRAPFDLPEGESEIMGYFIEYSGMKFGTFFLAEFADVVVASALLTTLFFGGWQIPFLPVEWFHSFWGTILQVLTFVFKVAFFCWFLLLIRWTFPRFRYDQLMRLGWKYMVPLALANVFVTGFIILILQ
jgi:NADH-quinone oxidoreductase subunit H